MTQTIRFAANFPPMQAAIKVGSDGMRITLDIPESEMAAALHLVTMRDKVLNVTISARAENVIGSKRHGATVLDE